MHQNLNYFLKAFYYLTIGYFTYLMVLITLQYIPIKFDVAFLNIKEEAISYSHYQIAFFGHVYASILVLISGITQFSESIRNIFPRLHKSLGIAYIFLILFIASPSGFIMALYANGGILSQISFSTQAMLWFFFTYKAYKCIRRKNVKGHQNFMLRSYALTLSAISLRLFKWGSCLK